MSNMLRPLVSVIVLTSLSACGDDDLPANTASDAGIDASPGESATPSGSATHTTSATASSTNSAPAPSTRDASVADASLDAGSATCEAITAACTGYDDVDGLGNFCLRVSDAADPEECGALSEECLDFCRDDAPPPADAGSVGAEECEEMGDRCHDLDVGHGLANLCHETGHTGNPAWCTAIFDECNALCGHLEPSDGGTDASTADASTDGGGATQSVTLNFRASFGDQEFACGQEYADQGTPSTLITPQDLRFYVSNVRLVNEQGAEVPLTIEERSPFQGGGVALLDFEDASGACQNGTPDTNSTVTGSVPAGSYSGVKFSTSVPADLNHQDPTTLPAPLQAGGMTWGWLYGYKFLKVEVLQVLTPQLTDAGPDASAPVPGAGLLHLGSTGCSNQVEADAGDDFAAPPTTACGSPNRNEIELTGFDPEANVIVADIAQLFSATDLTTASFCHSSGDPCPSLFESAGVDFDTGEALDVQTLFSVE
jgi:uncharacterized repeat protein (TIGR04052 family)